MGLRGPHAGESEATRFERYVHVEPNTGCHLWSGLTNGVGYGRFYKSGRVGVYAHRYAYESERGPIPEGLTLDHLCRTTLCVNPDHLEPVTLGENVRRERKVRVVEPATACSKGHPYDAANTRTGSGYRCRMCKRAKERQQRERRRQRAREHAA